MNSSTDGDLPPLPDWVPPFETRAPFWGGHLQTLAQKLHFPRDLSERFAADEYLLPLNDGTDDSLAAMLFSPSDKDNQDGEFQSPLIILLHGLGGTSQSSYIQSTANFLLQRGHRVLLIDFRGAGSSASHCDRLHGPGRTADLQALLDGTDVETKRKLRKAGVVLVGFSLGGSVLLKFLADSNITPLHDPTQSRADSQSDYADSVGIVGAVTVSAPLDLSATAKCLGRPSRWISQNYLLRRMRNQALTEGVNITSAERKAVEAARSLWTFDKSFTAPRCGFRCVEDYYEENSSGRKLAEVEVPTALIYARDDPFIPATQYCDIDWSSLPKLTPLINSTGGHCGFQSNGLDGAWHNHCIDRYVRRLIADDKAMTSNEP